MKKNIVKINENTLRKIVTESVKKVLLENQSTIRSELTDLLDNAMDDGFFCGRQNDIDFYECQRDRQEELDNILKKYNLFDGIYTNINS